MPFRGDEKIRGLEVAQIISAQPDEDKLKLATGIVRACNSHAALVEALEAYIAWHEGKCGSLSSSDKLREAWG